MGPGLPYPPLPGLATDEPELPLPDDELPLPLLPEEGEYVLELFDGVGEDELLLDRIICLCSERVLLLLLLLYWVD